MSQTIESMEQQLVALRPRASRIRLFFQEGEQTNDRRVIDIGATNFDRPPPWALRIQRTAPAEGGHANAELAGVLDAFYRNGPTLIVEGRIDLGSEAGSELERLAYDGILQTWSPDMSNIVVDIEEGVEDEDSNLNSPVEQLTHYRKFTFNGATLVAMPALGMAVIELLDDEGNVIKAAPTREIDTAAASDTHAHIVERVVAANETITADMDNWTAARSSAISACAGHAHPPAAFFAKQSLPEPQRWVEITADGHVYGTAACFSECHIGYLDRCVTIDMIADCRGEGSFEYAMPGHVITAEGTRIATGPLPIKGGHAPKGISASQALAHYDDPSTTVADICYYMDEHGVQFTGALRPTATEEQVRILRASGVSLDARQIGGKLRYLATCAVNTPGFPKVRLAAAATDDDVEILEMVAVGGRPIPADEDCGCEEKATRAAKQLLASPADAAINYLAITTLESELPPLGE